MMYFMSPLFKTIHHHHQMNVKTHKIELMQIDLPFALHSFTTVLPHFFCWGYNEQLPAFSRVAQDSGTTREI